MNGCDGIVYSEATENFETALACIALQGGLRPDQVRPRVASDALGGAIRRLRRPDGGQRVLGLPHSSRELLDVHAHLGMADGSRRHDLVDQLGRHRQLQFCQYGVSTPGDASMTPWPSSDNSRCLASQPRMTNELPTAPTIVDRAEQTYVAISGSVTMQDIGAFGAQIPEVFGWLAARGLQPTGAPFFRYNVIDMERQLQIEAAVPVADIAEGADGVIVGVLPAGRYATVTHMGHSDQIKDVIAALLDWAWDKGLKWDVSETAAAERWGCRLEIYKTNPSEELDMATWETEISFRLAG
jgi:effector-binding domain-containing protein